MTTRKKAHCITRPQRSALTIWVSKNEAIIREKTDPELAAAATKDLGFHVEAGNIAGERRVQYPALRRLNEGSPLISLVRDVEQRLGADVSALSARLTALESALGGVK